MIGKCTRLEVSRIMLLTGLHNTTAQKIGVMRSDSTRDNSKALTIMLKGGRQLTSVEMSARAAQRPTTKLSKYISHLLCGTMFHTHTKQF